MIHSNVCDGMAVAVGPDDFSGPGFNSSNKHPQGWPNACSEINDAVCHNGSTSDRPERNESGVSQVPVSPTIHRSPRHFPLQLAADSIDAIQPAIIRTETDAPIKSHGCQADRSIGVEPPQFLARPGIECDDTSVDHRSNKHPGTQHDRFVGRVKMQPGFIRPSGQWNSQLPGPLQVQDFGQLRRGTRRPLFVIPPHRPVGGLGVSRECKRGDGDKCGKQT